MSEAETPVTESESEPVTESESISNENSHLFAVRTTGGQEKVVLRLLEAKMRTGSINVQSILLVDNLKGYVVVEAEDPQDMFNAIQGLRHVRGQ